MATYDALTVLGVGSKVSPTTVIDTTTETALFSEALPQNILKAQGRNLHIRAWGTLSGATNTLTMKVKYGSVTVLQTSAMAFSPTPTADLWTVEGDVTTVIDTNAVEAFGRFHSDDDSGYLAYASMLNSSTISVSTAGAVTVSLTAEYGGSTTTQSITCRICQIEVGGLI